ncbi:MAG: FAD-dependent oxidoreductase [Alphaproteobacteria bacterium]
MPPYLQQYLISNDITEQFIKTNHQVIIIGDGIMALALAYYLSQNHDGEDIIIVSPTSLGASIKNRQWAMVHSNYQVAANTDFFEMNLRLWEGLSHELGYNVMLSQPGLINILLNDRMIKNARYRGNAMRLHGIDADYLELAELRRILPLMDFSDTARFSILAGLYQGRAGFFNPMASFYGFWRALSPRRVKIIDNANIKELVFGKHRSNGIKISKHNQTYHIQGQKIVLAMTDGGANFITTNPDIKKFFGKEMTAHFGKTMANGAWPFMAAQEIELLSESLSPMIDKIIHCPLTIGGVAGQAGGMASAFIGQGELGNVWLRLFIRQPLSTTNNNSDEFFTHLDKIDNADNLSLLSQTLARVAVQLIPALKRVKILTKWHQTFLSSCDGSLIIDKLFYKNGLYIISGIDGDGYAIAPAAAMAMAHLLATNQPHPSAQQYHFQRFHKGQFMYEKAV